MYTGGSIARYTYDMEVLYVVFMPTLRSYFPLYFNENSRISTVTKLVP